MQDKRAFASTVNDLLALVRLDPRGLQRHDMDTRAQQLAAQALSLCSGAKQMAAFGNTALIQGAQAIAMSLTDTLGLINNVLDHPEDLSAIVALGEAEKCLLATLKMLEVGGVACIVDEVCQIFIPRSFFLSACCELTD